jgi:16S rRNA (guanine(966)-N(2))-methyltransferase RsmD
LKIVAGIYKNRLLKAPKGDKTRPTSSLVRESLFNICRNDIEGVRFLDLCAGSGGVGLEALSRGASFAAFVEKSPFALPALYHNIETLKVQNETRVYKSDVTSTLKKLSGFDIVYADPPYELTPKDAEPKTFLAKTILEHVNSSDLLKPGGHLFIEEGGQINGSWENLELIDVRKLGKAFLHHYIKK